MGLVVLIALAPASFVLIHARTAEPGRVTARPAPRTCDAVSDLLALQTVPPDDSSGPFLFRWRDALRVLARGGDPVLRDRRRSAERVVEAFVRHGARDVEEHSDRWEQKVRYTGPLLASFVRNTATVHPTAPVLPAPAGWGCRGVTALRVTPSLAGFDAQSWARRAHLPGIGDATTSRALHDLPLLESDRRFTASCSRWFDHGLGSPLGRDWGGTVNVDTQSSLFGTIYLCGYGDRGHRLVVGRTSDLRRTLDLLDDHRRRPIRTPLGEGYRIEKVRLFGGLTSTAWVLLDPGQRGGLVLAAAPGLRETVLSDVAAALARTTYR